MKYGIGDTVKILIPNVVNSGYDYRLIDDANVGDFVSATVQNKKYTGLIAGDADGAVSAEKIKPVIAQYGFGVPETTVAWIRKMSEWTMMSMGAVLKLMTAAADFQKMDLKKIKTEKFFDTGKIKLNDEQKKAADEISQSGFSVTLLDGITGSGKTQVYFDSALRAYENGKSVLLMLPEIALTTQFMTRFADKFGARPASWHSNLTPARRRAVWHGVLSGDIKIVVGTRSALFLPWQDLGLIVVDEEHDSSYKQEEMGCYHARDMAILYAKIANIPIILSSATPSFETVQNANLGKYKTLRLTSRYGGAKLPKIEIADMRRGQK